MHPTEKVVTVAASVAVPSALVAWFVHTLPVLQWLAAALAIAVSVVALYQRFKKKK